MPLTIPTAGAASSSVAIVDESGDTRHVDGGAIVDEPKADIIAASARYHSGHIIMTMQLVEGDDLSEPDDMMFWSIGAQQNRSPDFMVEMRRGSNGFGQAVVSVPGDDPLDCPATTASFDVAAATYMVSLPATCVDSPDSFQWNAGRRVGTARDSAPDEEPAAAVSNSPMTGYWAIGSHGHVYAFGDAPKLGEPAPATAIDIDAAPHGSGYRTIDDKGIVKSFGLVAFQPVLFGSVTLQANEKAVSISGTPTGAGYWVFTNTGRVMAFGDANKDIGDVSDLPLNAEVLDSSPTPSGNGYYLVAADGGVFALGDAVFEGSMGATPLNEPVQAIVPDPDGKGYWLVASDGGVFAFEAPFRGSMGATPLNQPMSGMVPFGNGYLMVAEDGGVFNFSDQEFSGSLGDNPPTNPVVSITTLS